MEIIFVTYATFKWPVGLNPYCNGRYSWSYRRRSLVSIKLWVLILIVMEDTHGEQVINSKDSMSSVLILIVMEDTHGELDGFSEKAIRAS